MTTKILRHEENGVEYFTVVDTGESAISERGLAKLSGVPRTTVNRWLSDLTHESTPKWLKPLAGKRLHLTHEIIKKGGKFFPIKADIAAEFIGLVAENLNKPQAIKTLIATSKIGITSYIHGKTGYLPEYYKASKGDRQAIDLLILADAEERDVHFTEDWRKNAVRVTGYKWDGLPMANFIRRTCYDPVFNKETIERLKLVNPYKDRRKERRSRKHYEHIAEQVDEKILKLQIAEVLTILKLSPNLSLFWKNFKQRFGDGIQIELPLD